MSVTADLLASLDVITHETTRMQTVLNEGHIVRTDDRREAIRRVTELRSKAQEMLDWLSEVRFEDPIH